MPLQPRHNKLRCAHRVEPGAGRSIRAWGGLQASPQKAINKELTDKIWKQHTRKRIFVSAGQKTPATINMKQNAQVNTTSVTQTANELLGKKETKLYYLIIETPKGKITINVGEKTHDQVQKLTSDETTEKPVEKPLVNKK